MYYVTGDTHGNQMLWDICITGFLKPGDTIIVTGDFGIGFFKGRYWSEEKFFDYLAEQEYTVLFCDGNHENFEKLNQYEALEWNGGKVHFIRKNVIHLMRGEIYEIDGKRIWTFGGGYSLDKEFRVPGISWWQEEMPSIAEYDYAMENLEKHGYQVDYILTHTASICAIEYMSHLGEQIKNNVKEERVLNHFLQWVEENVGYQKWYFGHFHIDRELWRRQHVVYDAIRELRTGEIVRMRM